MSAEKPSHSSPPVPVLASGLEKMQASLAAMITESQALRSDVKVAEEARRRSTTVALALLVLIVTLMGMGLMITWQNNNVVRKVDNTGRLVSDCTTPGGRCYQQGSVRTGQAINDVIRAELYMAECARLHPNEAGPAYDVKLEACVRARLAKPGEVLVVASPTPSASPR